MIRVTIADDHPIVRQGLRQILIDDPDIKVVGEADTAQKLLDLIRKIRCDIVVLDIGMPGMSGLDALKQLKDEYPKLPVLILSVHPEDQYAVRVIKAGAAGYLTKDSAPEELIDAIRRVVIGRKYISPSLAEILASGAWTSGMLAHEKLSDREFQILGRLLRGKERGRSRKSSRSARRP